MAKEDTANMNRVTGEGARQTIDVPILYPRPWPGPYPIGRRDRATAMNQKAFNTGDYIEALEAIYPRPDVRLAVIDAARNFIRLAESDNRISEVLADLMDTSVEDFRSERIAPWLLVALAIVLGGALGYCSR